MSNEHNQTQVMYNILNRPEDEKVKLAKEFSEGNPELLELLIYLWGKNFETYACCAGHDEGAYIEAPYIFIETKNLSKSAIKRILEELFVINNLHPKPVVDFSVSVDQHNLKTERHGLSVYLRKPNVFGFHELLKLISVATTQQYGLIDKVKEMLIKTLPTKQKQFIDIALKMQDIDYTAFCGYQPYRIESNLYPSIGYIEKDLVYNFRDISQVQFDYKDAKLMLCQIKHLSPKRERKV